MSSTPVTTAAGKATARSPAAPPFRSLARTPSASESAWNAADVPLGGVYDLPEMETMARLERTLSRASCRPGRRTVSSVGRETEIAPAPEIQPVEAAESTQKGSIQLDTPEVEKRSTIVDSEPVSEEDLYSKFSPRRKRLIVATVAYCALLARECILLCCCCHILVQRDCLEEP